MEISQQDWEEILAAARLSSEIAARAHKREEEATAVMMDATATIKRLGEINDILFDALNTIGFFQLAPWTMKRTALEALGAAYQSEKE